MDIFKLTNFYSNPIGDVVKQITIAAACAVQEKIRVHVRVFRGWVKNLALLSFQIHI